MENYSVRRLNKISQINNANKYLEIGVETGRTFLEFDIEYKDGVDPNFLFDVKLHQNEKHRFFKVKSNDFWLSDKPLIYDIFFIDGLHTFEQTLRDIICSLRYAHDKSIWLIDDTVPSDIFSAIRDQKQSYDVRSRHQMPGNPWHGDVFKIIPAMREYFPTLDFVTIIEQGNPQTIAWFAQNKNFQPLDYNLEAVSRFDFLDIDKNQSIFNFKKENDAFSYLQNNFKV